MIKIAYSVTEDTEVDGNRSEKTITQVKIEDTDIQTLVNVLEELDQQYEELSVTVRVK